MRAGTFMAVLRRLQFINVLDHICRSNTMGLKISGHLLSSDFAERHEGVHVQFCQTVPVRAHSRLRHAAQQDLMTAKVFVQTLLTCDGDIRHWPGVQQDPMQ